MPAAAGAVVTFFPRASLEERSDARGRRAVRAPGVAGTRVAAGVEGEPIRIVSSAVARGESFCLCSIPCD